MAGYPFICNGANLAYRKTAFIRVKGFEGNKRFISGDDVFLMHKMKHEFGNEAIGFAKDKNALVKTYPAKSFLAFLDQRIRWASKSTGYRDPFAIATTIIVFVFNFILSVVFFAGFYHPGLFLLFAGFLALKSAADLSLMWIVTGFNGNRQLMKWYLPFQLVYPFYIFVAGIGSLFRRKRW
jgi:cellulose synthase/poly-beta-1,6-N-acetylglucosamine synthase-like glycosyltransferase